MTPQLPPDTRPDRPRTGTERDMLGSYLDFHRATVVWKLQGLDDEVLRRPCPPSATSLLGLVQHLRYAERYWFRYVFAGEDVTVPQASEDPGTQWRVAATDTLGSLAAAYQDEAARSRAIAAAHDLDDLARRPPGGGPHSLRFVLVHLLEETARHNGHVDILRESIDGVTGE